QMAERLSQAERPVLLVGGGCVAGNTPALLRELVNRCRIPVATTLMGIGAFPSGHPLHLGMVGMHGTPQANKAVFAADVLVCLGMRFSDRVTGSRKTFSPRSYKIQIDIDEAELKKNIDIDLALCGSVEEAMHGLVERMPDHTHDSWIAQIEEW